MSQIGDVIQKMRINAGFTQKTLADALHITDKAISKWERGICLPDTALMPKLALLLDVDMNHLMSVTLEEDDWVGLICIQNCDLSQKIYDKPLVYYLLSHFLLLGVNTIHVLTNEANQEYLCEQWFSAIGFKFIFDSPVRGNLMILSHPWFLFGSDLTQQFQGAMLSGRTIKLVPENQKPVMYFYRGKGYDKEQIRQTASTRTLGRGMICFDMNNYDSILDVSGFVRTYQRNSGMLIGSLEEIAHRRGLIDGDQLLEIAEKVPYGELLKKLAGKPQVS